LPMSSSSSSSLSSSLSPFAVRDTSEYTPPASPTPFAKLKSESLGHSYLSTNNIRHSHTALAFKPTHCFVLSLSTNNSDTHTLHMHSRSLGLHTA
jgi:hypothetical protein